MIYGKIGVSFLKFGLTFGFILAILKVILGWYYGYKNINGNYGGSYFYNWRVNYVDSKASKTFYKSIGLNEQDLKNEILYKYLDAVQGTDSKKITKSYDFDTKKYELTDKDRNELPYYAYGFTDTFVYPANKNWMLFNKKPEILNLELKFLSFRGNFIGTMYNLPSNEANIQKYFGNDGKTLKKSQFFTELDETKLEKFFKSNINFINISKLSKIILKIIDNTTSDYKLIMTKDSAQIQKNLEEDIMDFVKNIFVDQFNISKSDIEEFFYRVAVIKMQPMISHILNRIYSLCAMLFTGISDNSIIVPEFIQLIKNIEELKKELKKIGVDKDRIKRKIDVLIKKKDTLRAEIIFVKISQLFASLYSNDFILHSKDDKRSFFEKFGSPKLALETDFKNDTAWKKDKNLLNKELKKLLSKLV